MKQVVFISGKGGTGKSTIVASLSLLVQNKMMADCDVDAPNLHLLVAGDLLDTHDYSGSKNAFIDHDRCVSCGICRKVCRFDAISEDFVVDPIKCEGCAACTVLCPTEAIHLYDVKTGETYVTRTGRGTFSHAQLEIGADGSGKLVTEVRKSLAEHKNVEDWVLIDGSPGIGCVVIASITGTDAVVAVAEPTPSGRHDLDRVLTVAAHFKVPAYVCINKYDLNLPVSKDIASDCSARGIPVIGLIPYEPLVVKALQQGLTPVEANLGPIVEPIRQLWKKLSNSLNNQTAAQ